MNLAWHCRLVNRMINYKPDSTIADYYTIVDKENENESFQCAQLVKHVYYLAEQKEYKVQQKLREEERNKELRFRRKKRKFLRYKKKHRMRKFDLEIFMQQNPDFEKRRQERKERKEWFKNRRNGKPVTKRMCYKA